MAEIGLMSRMPWVCLGSVRGSVSSSSLMESGGVVLAAWSGREPGVVNVVVVVLMLPSA